MNTQRLFRNSVFAAGLTAALGLAIPAYAEALRVSGAPQATAQAAAPRPAATNSRMRTYAAPVRNISAIDKQITNQVIAVLGTDAYLRGRVEVATLDGVVTLIGKVESPAMADRAVRLVSTVGGVRGVDEASLATS